MYNEIFFKLVKILKSFLITELKMSIKRKDHLFQK